MARQILNFVIGSEEIARIDDFRFRNRFPTRAAAVKWLLKWALNENPQVAEETQENLRQIAELRSYPADRVRAAVTLAESMATLTETVEKRQREFTAELDALPPDSFAIVTASTTGLSPRQAVERIRDFRKGNKLGEGAIRDLIDEGRRY